MEETKANFLIKAYFALSQIKNNETQQILKSYYLLRCNKLIGKSGLPQKHFSHEKRCTHCLSEWRKEAEIRLNPIKLSRRQRRRVRSNHKLKKDSVSKKFLFDSNEMEKVCSFCGHVTKTAVLKPSAEPKSKSFKQTIEDCKYVENIVKKQNKKETKQKKHKYQSNVYCKSKVAFSLSKQMNTLSSHIKKSPKIIKNNKKKKDKFAGLCQTAVIAAAKLKNEKEKQNKLKLFLKPAI